MVTFLSYVGVGLVAFCMGKWVSHRKQVAAAFAAGGAAHAKSVALAQGGSVNFNGLPFGLPSADQRAGIDYDYDDDRGGYDDERAHRIILDEHNRLQREYVGRMVPIGRGRRPDGVSSGSAGNSDSDNGRGVGVARASVVERVDGVTWGPPGE